MMKSRNGLANSHAGMEAMASQQSLLAASPSRNTQQLQSPHAFKESPIRNGKLDQRESNRSPTGKAYGSPPMKRDSQKGLTEAEKQNLLAYDGVETPDQAKMPTTLAKMHSS